MIGLFWRKQRKNKGTIVVQRSMCSPHLKSSKACSLSYCSLHGYLLATMTNYRPMMSVVAYRSPWIHWATIPWREKSLAMSSALRNIKQQQKNYENTANTNNITCDEYNSITQSCDQWYTTDTNSRDFP